MKSRFRCLAIACVLFTLALPGLQGQGIQTSKDLDSWERDLQSEIESNLGRNGLPPGVETTWDFDVCIDGTWVVVGFSIVGRAGGGVILNQTFVSDSGRECKTSQDFQGIDLANADSMKRLVEFLHDVPKQSAVVTTDRLPPLRDVPFLPAWDPSQLPARSACSIATAADVLMVNHESGTVTRFNSCSRSVLGEIAVGSNPLQVDTTPDASLALVTGFDGTIAFIDTATNKPQIVRAENYNPSGVAISPDGSFAYVTSFSQTRPALIKVDIAQRRVTQIVPLPNGYPQSVFFNPDASQAYITFPFERVMLVIDTLTTSILRSVLLPARAFAVAFNSTATRAYITCDTTPGTLQVFDTATYTLLAPITVGNGPENVLISEDDRYLFVNNYWGQSVVLVDAATGKILSTADLPGRPHGLTQVR